MGTATSPSVAPATESSTTRAMAPEALPAPSTIVRPRGGEGRAAGRTFWGWTAARRARNAPRRRPSSALSGRSVFDAMWTLPPVSRTVRREGRRPEVRGWHHRSALRGRSSRSVPRRAQPPRLRGRRPQHAAPPARPQAVPICAEASGREASRTRTGVSGGLSSADHRGAPSGRPFSTSAPAIGRGRRASSDSA